jgi:hypothetical protein
VPVIKAMEEKYRIPALELVEAVFTASESPEEGALIPGGLEGICGQVSYADYPCLR